MVINAPIATLSSSQRVGQPTWDPTSFFVGTSGVRNAINSDGLR